MSKLYSLTALFSILILAACAQTDVLPDAYHYHDTPLNQAPGPEDLDWNDNEFPGHKGSGPVDVNAADEAQET